MFWLTVAITFATGMAGSNIEYDCVQGYLPDGVTFSAGRIWSKKDCERKCSTHELCWAYDYTDEEIHDPKKKCRLTVNGNAYQTEGNTNNRRYCSPKKKYQMTNDFENVDNYMGWQCGKIETCKYTRDFGNICVLEEEDFRRRKVYDVFPGKYSVKLDFMKTGSWDETANVTVDDELCWSWSSETSSTSIKCSKGGGEEVYESIQVQCEVEHDGGKLTVQVHTGSDASTYRLAVDNIAVTDLPDDWSLLNGKCAIRYGLVSTDRKDWKTAEENCTSQGGHLAIAANSKELEELRQYCLRNVDRSNVDCAVGLQTNTTLETVIAREGAKYLQGDNSQKNFSANDRKFVYVCAVDPCSGKHCEDCSKMKEKYNLGKGECYVDAQCRGDLVCGENNCAWSSRENCCIKRVTTTTTSMTTTMNTRTTTTTTSIDTTSSSSTVDTTSGQTTQETTISAPTSVGATAAPTSPGSVAGILGAVVGVTVVIAGAVAIVAFIKWNKDRQVVEETRTPVTTPKVDKAATDFWNDQQEDEPEQLDAIAFGYMRRNHYSIKMPSDGLQLPPLPVDTRTFKTSNYRRLYLTARCLADTSELLIATKHLVRNYVRKRYRELASITEADDEQKDDEKKHEVARRQLSINSENDNGRKFFDTLVEEASKDKSVWENLSAGAELLWTSGKKSSERSGGVEFCGIINAAIREDDPRDLIHLVMIARCINNRVIRRGADASSRKLDKLWMEKFPRDGIVYRGGAFNNRFQSFFALGKKYRVPGYLATSLRRKIAVAFALRASETMARVLWRISVDVRGITDPIYRCRHAFVLEKTHIPGEEEYLFVPYSTFTVMEAKWSDNSTEPHEILVTASKDNLNEDDDLPLAPWY